MVQICGTLRVDAVRVPQARKEPEWQQAAFDVVWQQRAAAGAVDHVFTCVVMGEPAVTQAVSRLKQFTPVLVLGELRARDGNEMKLKVTSWQVVDGCDLAEAETEDGGRKTEGK